MAAPIMTISDDSEPTVGLWDYHAPEHPYHGAGEVEAALRELRALREQEDQLTAIIRELTRPAAGLRGQAQIISFDERRVNCGAAGLQP